MFADNDVSAAQAPAGVFHDRERLGQQVAQPEGQLVVVLDLGKLLFPGGGLLAQDIIRALLQLGLEGVDLLDQRSEALDLPIVLRANEFLYDEPNHDCFRSEEHTSELQSL